MPICSHCQQNIVNITTSIERIYNGSCSSYKYTLYFCNDECHNLFKTLDECQICYSQKDEYELVNGFRVCSLNEDWVEKPTCMQKYTGKYHCLICNKERNVEENRCFVYTDDTKDYCKYYNICCQCYKGDKYYHMFSEKNSKWSDIYEHHEGYDLLKLWMKTMTRKFVCNDCSQQKNIAECNIIDDRNVCNSCSL